MATLTAAQIEQKKNLLEEKLKAMKALYDELVEAGAIELSEDDLDKAAGGSYMPDRVIRHKDPDTLDLWRAIYDKKR